MTDLPPRRRLRKINKQSEGDRAKLAELLVAEMYDLEHVGDDGDWYDAIHPTTSTKYQVKSTAVERNVESASEFRLWEGDHRSLVASAASGEGTAWYAFVLFGPNGGIVAVQRRQPSTVTRIVQENDGWRPAGHEDKDGRQSKLEYGKVVDA